PDGRLFVADSALGRVFILDKEGRPAGELRGDPAGLGRPVGLALAEDRLYVSDVARHRVAMYDLAGVFIAAFGRRGGGLGEFNFPTYLWYEAARRRLWVCDSGNFRVQRLTRDGVPDGAVGGPGNRPGYLARPRGVALDSDGHLYVVDGAFEAVSLFDRDGRLLLFVGSAGSAPGEFALPGGLFIDTGDRVLVADTLNARVQILRYAKGPQP
ncbi:MAG: NHL repeat protein, partial [Elusimicrobia bacterium]